MHTLGITVFYHYSTVCIISNGFFIAHFQNNDLQEKRETLIKFALQNPNNSYIQEILAKKWNNSKLKRIFDGCYKNKNQNYEKQF